MAEPPNNLAYQIAKFVQQLPKFQISDEMQATIKAAKALSNTLGEAFSRLANWYEHEGQAWLKTAVEAVSYYQRNSPHWLQTAVKLSDDSWFAGPCIGASDLFTLMDTAYRIPEMVDDVFMRFYSNEIDELSEELCGYFPSRAGIIRSAVDAHKAGNYNLSIPTFFSQTDGFCYDVHRSIFDGMRNTPVEVTKDASKRLHIQYDAMHIASQNEDFAINGFFLPILGKTPNIALGERQRHKNGYHGLNRNAVLHGEDTTYGTEINSLKAFSFMVFVAGFIQVYKEDMNNHLPLQAATRAHQDPL